MSISRYHDTYTLDEDKQILRMRSEGKTAIQIAHALNRTQLGITSRLTYMRKIGVKVPKLYGERMQSRDIDELNQYIQSLQFKPLKAVA